MARKVKYDHDKKNDYSDGYSAGRRFFTRFLKALLKLNKEKKGKKK